MRPAEIFALAAYRLLKDGAKEAKKIIRDNAPPLTKEAYRSYMDSVRKTECFLGDSVEILPLT